MEKSTASMKARLFLIIFVVMVLVAGYISYTMYDVAIKESDKYQARANSQQFKTMTISANRGSIYDTNGQVLAQSVTVYTVYVDPKTYQDRDKGYENLIVQTLSTNLDIDDSAVRQKLYKNTQYEVIARDVDKLTAENIISALTV